MCVCVCDYYLNVFVFLDSRRLHYKQKRHTNTSQLSCSDIKTWLHVVETASVIDQPDQLHFAADINLSADVNQIIIKRNISLPFKLKLLWLSDSNAVFVSCNNIISKRNHPEMLFNPKQTQPVTVCSVLV